MKDIVFVDPTNWLKTFLLDTRSQVYANQQDGLRSKGSHILINDFMDPIDYNKADYDLVFYTGFENPIHFYKKMQKNDTTHIISPGFVDDGKHFCHPSMIYSGASLINRRSIAKPNYHSKYLADLFIGRVDRQYGGSRVWSYYWTLINGWQDRMIFTARYQAGINDIELDMLPVNARDFIAQGQKVFGDIGCYPLPDYDEYEKSIWSNKENVSSDLISEKFSTVEEKCLDFFIPEGVYRESSYSIIMTDYSHNSIYLDEKIARAIIFGRPFIVVGQKGYLAHLHRLGFQTFEPVIDESYDQIENDHERWSQAFKSLESLSHQNPQSVYDRLRKRLQHNRKLAYNSEYWISKLKNYLNSVIEQYTGQQCVIY